MWLPQRQLQQREWPKDVQPCSGRRIAGGSSPIQFPRAAKTNKSQYGASPSRESRPGNQGNDE